MSAVARPHLEGPLDYHETLDPALSVGGGSSALKTTDDIQTALNAASAGDTVELGAGTWDLGSGTLEIPNDVHLKGAGQDITIIQSIAPGNSAPFHGIVAPGNNSLIQDLTIKVTDLALIHSNPLSVRAGGTKTHTNVTYRNVHLWGGLDVIYSAGRALGDFTFENCLLEGPCDIVVHQHFGIVTFRNCEIRHTTQAGGENLTSTMVFNGAWDNGNVIYVYGCRFTMGGLTSNNHMTICEASTGNKVGLYIFDTVIDNHGLSTGTDAFMVDVAGALVMGNFRRADGQPLIASAGSEKPIFVSPANYSCTVAMLPASPFVGLIATVTDGDAGLAWGATVVNSGAGATKYLVAWNGTNWTVIGK